MPVAFGTICNLNSEMKFTRSNVRPESLTKNHNILGSADDRHQESRPTGASAICSKAAPVGIFRRALTRA